MNVLQNNIRHVYTVICRAWGFGGFRVGCLGFRVQGVGFGAQASRILKSGQTRVQTTFIYEL